MLDTDKEKFAERCSQIRDAKAAVDVFQRTGEKGGFESVVIHVHTEDDAGCITRFTIPVGACNSFLDGLVSGIETAERIASVLGKLEEGFKQDGRLRGGYRAGDLA